MGADEDSGRTRPKNAPRRFFASEQCGYASSFPSGPYPVGVLAAQPAGPPLQGRIHLDLLFPCHHPRVRSAISDLAGSLLGYLRKKVTSSLHRNWRRISIPGIYAMVTGIALV